MKHKRSIISIAMATIVLVSLCAVFASTSVSAAPSSSANGLTSKPEDMGVSTAEGSSSTAKAPDLMRTSVSTVASSSSTAISPSALVGAQPPYGIVGSPAMCSQGYRSLDVFVLGSDGNIWWRHWDGGQGVWSAWKSIGKPNVGVTSSPTAASHTLTSGLSGIMYVAVRGGDGVLWRTFTDNGGITWQPWYRFGGGILAGTGPTAFAPTSTTIRYAVTGTTSHLYYWTGSSWMGLSGTLTSSPSGGVPTANQIYITVRGTNGACYYKYSNNGGTSWNGFYSIGGQIRAGTSPCTAAPTTTSVRPLVTGANSGLYYWTGSSWMNLYGTLTSSPAAVSHTSGAIDVFVRGVPGTLYARWTVNSGTSWGPWYGIA